MKQDSEVKNYTLRDEQRAAVRLTQAYYQRCQQDAQLDAKFLWNAKPRFGKTLTAYDFAATIQARKVLIVTNRPAAADGWYTDFKKFGFQDTGQGDERLRWIFTSSEAVKKRLGDPADVLTREQQTTDPKLRVKNLIHFISLQDMKGRSMDGFKSRNSWIFDLGKEDAQLGWDLVIIDESHEGVETTKAFAMFEKVHTRFTLYLSGTPFKALASNKFRAEQLYNWSYSDEQRRKLSWAEEAPNPYAELPGMKIFTYQLPCALGRSADEVRSEEDEYLVDLGELFRTAKVDGEKKFVHEAAVRKLVANLHNPRRQYPFSTKAQREYLRHTFWLLPGVEACRQLKKILLEDEYFGANYDSKDIIMATGHGDADRAASTALDEVRRRIGKPGFKRNPLTTRTITLSCSQLSTGVTIPEWTGVLMLNNCKSPSLYMQAAFRAQNPCQMCSLEGEVVQKQDCFVFDFAPDRILRTLSEMANAGELNPTKTQRQRKVQELIEFLPVIGEDETGKMQPLDAQAVLTLPLQLVSDEVVMRGFMSNRLFKNISGIFSCPPKIREILNKMDEAHADKTIEKDPQKKSTITGRPRIWLDRERRIHINEEIVVSTTHGFFDDRNYVEIGSAEHNEIKQVTREVAAQAQLVGYTEEAIRAVTTALTKRMPRIVVALPELEPRPGDADYCNRAKDDTVHRREKSDEEKVRDRLRAFARTIPSFLMAYGTEETTLQNFDKNVPDEIFEELTSITKAEFHKLRDGMDYQTQDEQGKLITAHFKGLFDEEVFNSAIQKFNQKRQQLANYYRVEAKEDIFEYIPPQATNQIFTPRAVVKLMLDKLEKTSPGIFRSKTNTFIDLYMKSGMYIAETVKRIFRATHRDYANDAECIKHILEKQVYGFTPTPILKRIIQNYLFGFDAENKITKDNFQEFDTTTSVKNQQLDEQIKNIFGKGKKMKFTAVVGNPPYMEMATKTTTQTQRNSNWIYQYFQRSADKLGKLTCLIYPFGGWFDSPRRLGGFGNELMKDGHTVSIEAYEATADRRAWYRNDREPQPIFGTGANLSAGVAIVLRNLMTQRNSFWYANRIYTDERIRVKTSEVVTLTPNPAFQKISAKLVGERLSANIKKGIFGIESNFAELNADKVSDHASDWPNPVRLLTNDRAGSTGRARFYWIDRANIPRGHEYIDTYKVVTTSAYPKKTFVAGNPTIANVKARLHELVEILPKGSAYGRSRISLFMSTNEQECQNFLRYTQTNFFAALLLQEPNRRSSFGDIILSQDYSVNSDIDWTLPLEKIDQQLCQKYQLTDDEAHFLGIY